MFSANITWLDVEVKHWPLSWLTRPGEIATEGAQNPTVETQAWMFVWITVGTLQRRWADRVKPMWSNRRPGNVKSSLVHKNRVSKEESRLREDGGGRIHILHLRKDENRSHIAKRLTHIKLGRLARGLQNLKTGSSWKRSRARNLITCCFAAGPYNWAGKDSMSVDRGKVIENQEFTCPAHWRALVTNSIAITCENWTEKSQQSTKDKASLHLQQKSDTDQEQSTRPRLVLWGRILGRGRSTGNRNLSARKKRVFRQTELLSAMGSVEQRALRLSTVKDSNLIASHIWKIFRWCLACMDGQTQTRDGSGRIAFEIQLLKHLALTEWCLRN